MKNRETVIAALDDIKSIKQAERRKAQLENAGYTLVHEQCNLTTAMFIYEMQS